MRQSYRVRKVKEPPQYANFKPCGIPRRLLEKVVLSVDEYEAIRLADYLALEHLEASKQMDISRPTFTRLIEKARSKLAVAIIDGKELVIEGGNVSLIHTLHHCHNCGKTHRHPVSKKRLNCQNCGSSNVQNLADTVLNK